jgi:hypothetical protein
VYRENRTFGQPNVLLEKIPKDPRKWITHELFNNPLWKSLRLFREIQTDIQTCNARRNHNILLSDLEIEAITRAITLLGIAECILTKH